MVDNSPVKTDTGENRFRATIRLSVRFALQLWWTAKTNRWLPEGVRQSRLEKLYATQAREFREFAAREGGLIVKLGQFLSVRIDVLPKAYIDELSLLQDAMPAVPSSEILRMIETELGAPADEIFAEFDPVPLAAASLGQVHRARLTSGEDVAVKVQRPGIEDLIDVDIRSLRTIGSWLNRLLPLSRWFDVQVFLDEFEQTTREELDYQAEGRNAETFQRNFLLSPHVEMPKIFWDYSTKRVLTEEFLDGVKIDDLAALDAMGVDRAAVAAHLVELYLQMALVDGFFHADPHPGNVLVRSDGIIQLIDFGMVGALPEQMSEQFVELLLATLRHDGPGVVTALRSLGFVGEGADDQKLARALLPVLDTLMGDLGTMFTGPSFLDAMTGDGVAALSSTGFDMTTLDAIREVILTQPIELPGNVTFLGKALITVFSDAYRLDPELDVVQVLRPYLDGLSQLSPWTMLNRALREGLDLAKSLPGGLRNLVSLAQKLDSGSFELRLSQSQLRELESRRRSDNRHLLALITAAVAALLAAILRRHP